MREAYKKQVSLLLEILPEVAKEEVFALLGWQNYSSLR
jgi:hypothetical protein